MIIKFAHGSKSRFDKFEYFNYLVSSTDKTVTNISTKEVISTNGFGNDAGGQGIYGVIDGKPDDVQYYTENEGCIYFCSVEIDRFCNDIDIEEVDLDKWKEVVDLTYKKIDLYHNYDSEIIENLIGNAYNGEDENIDALDNHFEDIGIDIDDFIDRLRDGEDPGDVLCELEDYLSYSSPSGSMKESRCIDYNRIYNVAELIQDTGSLFINESGVGITSYNKYFYESFKEIYGDEHDYIAYKSEDHVIVVFDKDQISIDNTIDLEKRNKSIERDRQSGLEP